MALPLCTPLRLFLLILLPLPTLLPYLHSPFSLFSFISPSSFSSPSYFSLFSYSSSSSILLPLSPPVPPTSYHPSSSHLPHFLLPLFIFLLSVFLAPFFPPHLSPSLNFSSLSPSFLFLSPPHSPF